MSVCAPGTPAAEFHYEGTLDPVCGWEEYPVCSECGEPVDLEYVPGRTPVDMVATHSARTQPSG